MMQATDRFQALLDKYRDDPEFITEGLLIEINEQIVRALERQNMSRAQLAEKLDVSKAYITKLLNGNQNLTMRQLVRICLALECSVDLAVVPRPFEVNRFFSYTSTKTSMKAIDTPVNVGGTHGTDISIAA